MNRVILMSMTVIGLLAISGAAHAATARFCATWATPQFEDGDFGEDYLDLARTSPATTYHLAAKYTAANVYKGETLIWEGVLNTSGCTPYVTVSNGNYAFRRYSLLSHGDRDVRIMLDNWEWEEWSPDSLLQVVSSWNLFNVSGNVTINAPHTATTNQGRMMPVFAQLLGRSETYDLLETGTTIWVSTDPDPQYPHTGAEDGCNRTQMWQSTTPGHPEYFHICVSDDSADEKYIIAHEYGHAVSKYKDGPTDGSYKGSEGWLRATGDDDRCNCDNVSSTSKHCLHSREFTGSGQKEGFSHFVATLGYNARSTSVSYFMYYKDVRKWSSSHGGTLTWPLVEPPWPPPPNEYTPPFKVEMSTSDNVKWMEYECDPTGGLLEHYGTEWDWLDFYWNLWTEGSYKFSVNQMMNVWDNVPDGDIAYICCDADYIDGEWIPMRGCLPRNPVYGACGGPNYSVFPHEFEVGKLWDTDTDYDVMYGVIDKAFSLYGANMRDNFVDKGYEAGVDH
jgi:hypothetical protein